MANLEYQHPKDASREEWTRRRLRWFGPNQAEVWGALAQDIGARFERGGWFKHPRVIERFDCWQIVMDTFVVSTGKTHVPYTRLRAPFVNSEGFRFCVFRKHLFSGLAEWFGMQDVRIGDERFDEPFIIRGNDEPKLRRFFENEQIRELIASQSKIRFEIKGDDGILKRRLPEDVDLLQFLAVGIIKDLDQLKWLFELSRQSLRQLERMRCTPRRDPGVELS